MNTLEKQNIYNTLTDEQQLTKRIDHNNVTTEAIGGIGRIPEGEGNEGENAEQQAVYHIQSLELFGDSLKSVVLVTQDENETITVKIVPGTSTRSLSRDFEDILGNRHHQAAVFVLKKDGDLIAVLTDPDTDTGEELKKLEAAAREQVFGSQTR